MAITITTPSPGKFGWIINATSADASGCEELKAAPAAGTSIIVDHLTINNGSDAISITIGAGKTGAAVTTALIGPGHAGEQFDSMGFSRRDKAGRSNGAYCRCFGLWNNLHFRLRAD